MNIVEKNVYGLFDRGRGELVSLFVSKNDFTALQMNLHSFDDEKIKPFASQFTLIRLGSLSDSLDMVPDKKVLCRLCDISSEFDKALAALEEDSIL